MKRVGQRGANEWETISWDKAFDLAGEQMALATKKYGPYSIMVGAGGGGDPYIGKLLAIGAVKECGEVSLIDVDELSDDDVVVPVASVGAPTILTEKGVGSNEFTKLIDMVGSYYGKKITAIMPIEAGGVNSMLPIAAAGIDIAALMEGAARAMKELSIPGMDNPAWQYAAARHALYESGKSVELLACYEPSFRFFAEWWKQLYGESEGKEGKGLFPASVEFTADLHSMGQYIQQGERVMFETVVRYDKPHGQVVIGEDADNVDGLNFLAGKDLHFVCEQAMRGTRLAHVDGGVPNILIETDTISARSTGELIYFFELACGISGYVLGVNPFNQPGVEAYKKNMFALLDKPGYSDLRADLLARLGEQ